MTNIIKNNDKWNGSYLEDDEIVRVAGRMEGILLSSAGLDFRTLIIALQESNIELGIQRFTDEYLMVGGRIYTPDGYCKLSDIVNCIKPICEVELQGSSFSELLSSAYKIHPACSDEGLRNKLKRTYKRNSVASHCINEPQLGDSTLAQTKTVFRSTPSARTKSQNANKTKPSYCYILRLQNGKYYIGSAFDPSKRYSEHLKGKGSTWTKLHPPIEQIKQIKCASLGESLITEDALTLWMMVTYGKDNVRGGRWLKEGTKHLPELYDARNIMDLHRKDKATIRDELMILALKSGLKYSWYWVSDQYRPSSPDLATP